MKIEGRKCAKTKYHEKKKKKSARAKAEKRGERCWRGTYRNNRNTVMT